MVASAAVVALALFASLLVPLVLWRSRALFAPRHGRRHRLTALAYGTWLASGIVEHCSGGDRRSYVFFDAVLGVLGLATTLSAAFDFAPKIPKAPGQASGTLHEKATVTYSEMMEHSFYQGLNLLQALYLHAISDLNLAQRLALLFCATLPWAWRKKFPVNSFSENYAKDASGRSENYANDASGITDTRIALLYRAKKYQYVFYKHALLHGLNASAALTRHPVNASSKAFRTYWLCLNTSYTMEFFLQTLVKRKHLGQIKMLRLNALLMVASSLAALQVLRSSVDWRLASLSLVLNFVNRGRDVSNTAYVACLGAALVWHTSAS
ncbi:hypothetical protein M885DRAFT_547761 [Pelagophyceae sp. CCMP2097]|nr:hypothetical protein M885DRAFT_547761 [Pelagophyceae sp. CCMP2097]